jgi:ketosteroid isomerase-like protein
VILRVVGESNAEIVRGMYDAFNRRDVTAAFARISPDIEVDYHGVLIDARGSYGGHEGGAALTRAILESIDVESYTIEVEDITEQGDRVAVALHQRGRGVSSGVPVDVRNGHLWTLHDGQAVRWAIYKNRKEAWDALEPGEQP